MQRWVPVELQKNSGAGAEQHAEGGIRTGRQADPGYKRPQQEQQPSPPPASTAGFAGALASAAACARCAFSALQLGPVAGCTSCDKVGRSMLQSPHVG